MANIAISQQWLDSLSRYVEGVQTEATQRSEAVINYFHERVVERARETPGWEDLADQITVWSEDGLLYIGVTSQDYVSQAWAVEYGDADHTPNALFRALTSEVSLANAYARTAAQARYGTRVT
jgi:hypothetical protein